MCRGMIALVISQYGVGWVKTNLTVSGSSASTCLTLRQTPTAGDPVAGSAVYSQLKTTSPAVNGLPSCQETPGFSFHVTDVPSFATPPFLTLGTSRARAGIMLACGSNHTSEIGRASGRERG